MQTTDPTYLGEMTELTTSASLASIGRDIIPKARPEPGSRPPTPTQEVVYRKTVHDIMIFMRAAGKSNKFIAEQLNYSPGYVGIVTRQPWFLRAVNEIISETGQTAVDRLLRDEQENCVLTLLELRDSAKSESVRKDSAIHLMDRFRGRCPQHIIHDDGPPISDPVAEASAIRDRVDTLSKLLLDGEGATTEQEASR